MTSSLRSIEPESIKNHGALKAVQFPSSKFPLHLVAPQGQLQIHKASFRGTFSIVLSEALRAAGLGRKVLIAQFLKGGVSQGPNKGINLCGNLNWIRPDIPCCPTLHAMDRSSSTQNPSYKAIRDIWEFCKEQLEKQTIDKLILDEIGLACSLGFVSENDLISTLSSRPTATDIILTGTSISSDIIAMADQVTELR